MNFGNFETWNTRSTDPLEQEGKMQIAKDRFSDIFLDSAENYELQDSTVRRYSSAAFHFSVV